MDAVICVRDYLLDKVGHMTFPGNASFDAAKRRWLVPIYCRSDQGAVFVGEVQVDDQGQVVSAPTRDDMLARMSTAASAL